MGDERGGYLAALVGTSLSERRKEKDTFEQESSRVNAVVAYFPTGFDWTKEVELAESLPALKIDPAVLDSLSLKHHVSIHSSPTLIIYGEDDSDFIVEPSEALHSEMQKQGVESKLIAIPETGHLFLGKDAGFNVRAGEYAMFELVLWFQMYLVKK